MNIRIGMAKYIKTDVCALNLSELVYTGKCKVNHVSYL